MKKRLGLLYALTCLLISCGRHDGNADIAYKDKGDHYSMHAHFNKSKTKAVEHYMNDVIGDKNNISFSNVTSDATFTLDDGTNFYMKKSPGHIEIEMDKSKNSNRSFYNIKSMCEGIKEVVLK